jgi:GT2 family glycosyltransferase
VVFIDDDALANENWLEKLVKNYDEPNVMGVGGLSKPLWEFERPICLPEELYWIIGCSYTGLPREKADVRNPIGCNMSFRKRVFEEVGYFRTDIGRMGKKPLGDEETEFSIRVLEGIPNSRIIYDPEVVVQHSVRKNRTSLKYIWNRSFYEGLGKALIRQRLKSLTPLKTESNYLRYLLGNSIPSRLKNINEYKNVCQLLILGFSTFGVLAGFFSGSLRSSV